MGDFGGRIQWSYASKDYRVVDRSVHPPAISLTERKNLIIPALSVAAIILALLQVPWSSLVYFVSLLFIGLIPPGRIGRRLSR